VLTRSLTQPIHVALINWVLFGALAAIAFSYIVFLTLDPSVARSLASEDSLIENLGAVFCLIAAFFFLMAYFESKGLANRFLGRATQHNWWLLLLALLMFLCFGEEISWGQRILGWSTPSAFEAFNAQHETNIHNLWVFHAKESDGSPKTALELLINFNRLLSMFWLAYCVAVPLLTMVSAKARQTVSFFGFPVARFAAGTLFVINFAIFRFIVTYGPMDRVGITAFDELKETNYEFAFMILALCFLADIIGSVRRERFRRVPDGWRP